MRKLLTILLVLTFFFSGCASEQEKDQYQGRTVRICSSMNEAVTKILTEAFQEQEKVRVQVDFLPPGSLDSRLEFLRKGEYDVWFGGTVEEYYLAGERNLLTSYQPDSAYKIPAELRENNWRWTGLYVDYIGIISNKDNLRNLGLYAPDSWEELLRPAFKNEITLAEPKNGGVSYGMITTLWQLRGQEQALRYAAVFNEQEPMYTATEIEAIRKVQSGEKTLAIVPLSYAVLLERDDRNLFATLLKDGNKNSITGVAILKGAHLEEAKAFVDYLLADKSKELLTAQGYPLLWRVNDYADDDGRKLLIGDLPIVVDDLSWTAGQKSSIIHQWLVAR